MPVSSVSSAASVLSLPPAAPASPVSSARQARRIGPLHLVGIIVVGVVIATFARSAEAAPPRAAAPPSATWAALERAAARAAVAGLRAAEVSPQHRQELAAVVAAGLPALRRIEADLSLLARDAAALWTAEEVELAKAEALRVEALTAVDEGSAAALPLMVEAANTMSAEERARLLRVGRRAAAAKLGLR